MDIVRFSCNLHGFLVNISKGAAQVDISGAVELDGIVVVSLKQCHTKGIAKPVTRLADSRRKRTVVATEIGLGNHSDSPPRRTLVTDLCSTIPAMEALAFRVELGRAAHAVYGSGD